MANPGRALRAEIDHIPINVIREIIPFPVCICIALVFIQLCKKTIEFCKGSYSPIGDKTSLYEDFRLKNRLI